jgi:TolB-like protein
MPEHSTTQSIISPTLIKLIRKIANKELVHESEDFPIAVFTFINMYSNPEQGYFSYGTSELLNVLAKSDSLNAAAHSTSLLYFKGQNFCLLVILRRHWV